MVGAYYEIIFMPRCVYSEHERLHSTMNQWVHPGLMPPVFLGEGEDLADEARNALAQGFVPALHVRGLLCRHCGESPPGAPPHRAFQKSLKLSHLR